MSQLGISIYALIFVNDFIYAYWLQKEKLINYFVKGNPVPWIYTIYPPLLPPDVRLLDIRLNDIDIGLTIGFVSIIPISFILIIG